MVSVEIDNKELSSLELEVQRQNEANRLRQQELTLKNSQKYQLA